MLPSKKSLTEGKADGYSSPPEDILGGFGIGPTDWDVLIAGDGSGTGWNAACGWASVLVDRKLKLRKTFVGGMNSGTCYLAELLPYVQALSWYADGPGKAHLADLRKVNSRGRLRVHVITDNAAVAQQGVGGCARRKGNFYWKMIEGVEEAGYCLNWHWVGRSKLALNRLCDHLAGLCRKGVGSVAPVGLPDGTTAYDYNPDPPVVGG